MATAEFKILGIESGSFERVITKHIRVTYTGQEVTYTALKAATQNKFPAINLTGTEISGSNVEIEYDGRWKNHMLYEIDQLTLIEHTVDYIIFDKNISITLD